MGQMAAVRNLFLSLGLW